MSLPRIAFVSASAGIQAGGAEAYTFATASGLRARGVPVTILHGAQHGQNGECPCQAMGADHWTGPILPRAGAASTLLRRMGAFRATRTSPYDLEAIWRDLFSPHGWDVLREFDVVEVQYATETLLFRYARRSALKILHLHGPSMPIWLPWLCRATGTEPDLVVTCSEWSRAELLRRNVPWPVEVNYNGVDERLFYPEWFDDRGAEHSRPFRVGFTGRLSAAKGLDTLAAVARELGADFEFHVAGPVEGGYVLPRAANIFYYPAMGPSRIAKFLRGLDCFYFPTLRESFGISAVEAMATGLPVIASEVGGLPEVIQSGVNGILVPVMDQEKTVAHLRQLRDREGMRRALGLAARATVLDRFTTAHTARRLLEINERWDVREARTSPRVHSLEAAS
jgi:glycosyltransferase involved in cell wall biosynthesis